MRKIPLLRPDKACCEIITVLLMLFAVLRVEAQEPSKPQPAASSEGVTASATRDRIRISAPNATVQMRLEVYDEVGRKVFDTEQRGGSVLDWSLNGGTGARVSEGNYVCVVIVKDLPGRFSQKLAKLSVNSEQVLMAAIGATELSSLQRQALGPVDQETQLVHSYSR